MRMNRLLLVLAVALIYQPCSTECQYFKDSSYAELPYAGSRSSYGQDNNSCAPGFSGTPCKCDASEYKGMICFGDKAYIIDGYWVGVCENGTLCTSNCPFGFCAYKYNGSTDPQLPGRISELNDYMCGPTRTGVLCSKCRENHSVSYHSYIYSCTSDDKCKYGPLLYIVSELIPLTILFVMVIAFNISITTGAVNGIIFFAQIQDSLGTHSDTLSRFAAKNWYVQSLSFYRFFNLEFFGIEPLSFCLWRGATVLDVLTFKYVTITCASLLVIFCALVINSPKVKRCFPCLRPTTLRSTFIHGLTAFFVMCYSQCAHVSFRILWPTSLYAKDGRLIKTVVFADGELSMFEPTHIKYAIPAFFFGSILLVLPPVVLITYPLLFKILARCNLSESKPVNCLSRLVPMQLLDSFQSCFRDETRFFAGLFFVYRLIPQIIWSIGLGLTMVYSLLTVLFILTLTLHAAIQPYKQRIHNVLDAVIFADIALICILSLLGILKSTDQELLTSIQLALFYLPLICLLLMVLLRILKAVVRYCKTRRRTRQETTSLLTDSCDLPPLREE